MTYLLKHTMACIAAVTTQTVYAGSFTIHNSADTTAWVCLASRDSQGVDDLKGNSSDSFIVVSGWYKVPAKATRKVDVGDRWVSYVCAEISGRAIPPTGASKKYLPASGSLQVSRGEPFKWPQLNSKVHRRITYHGVHKTFYKLDSTRKQSVSIEGDTYDSIIVKNPNSYSVNVCVFSEDMDGKYTTKGFWTVDPYGKVFVAKTRNRRVWLHGVGAQGSRNSIVWSGPKWKELGGTKYGFMPFYSNPDGYGPYTLTLDPKHARTAPASIPFDPVTVPQVP